MKFALFLVLSCLGVCFVNSMTVTSWGNTNARTLGTENVIVKSSILRVKTHTFTYPKVNKEFPRAIIVI